MISFKKSNFSKVFSYVIKSNCDVVSVRFCSFDGRCRASRVLQPLNLLPFDEDGTNKTDINKFENVSARSQRLLVDLGFLRLDIQLLSLIFLFNISKFANIVLTKTQDLRLTERIPT